MADEVWSAAPSPWRGPELQGSIFPARFKLSLLLENQRRLDTGGSGEGAKKPLARIGSFAEQSLAGSALCGCADASLD